MPSALPEFAPPKPSSSAVFPSRRRWIALGWPALATYHPAYLLRLRGVGSEDYDRLRSQVVEDLRAAWQRAQGDG